MIKIFYTRFSSRLPEDLWQKYKQHIPPGMRTKITRFRRWQDRQATLFGKMLLIEALKEFGSSPEALHNLSYNPFGRPFLKDGIDFNISHSDNCVVCASTDMGRVGIDLERIRPVDLNDFRYALKSGEWTAIEQSDRPHDTFFEYWTKKESILKANGQGLSVPLNKIHIHRNIATLYDEHWFLRELSIATEFKCHLAASEKDADLIVRNVSF